MNRLNIEIVKQAISEIRAAGMYPSFKAILKHIGFGSYSTLTKLKAQYPSVFDTQNALDSDTLNTQANTENTTQANTHTTDNYTLNTLLTTAINTHFNALEQRFEQKFVQLKSELLDTIKKNDFDVNNSTPELVQENQDLHQQIRSIETDYRKLEDEYKSALHQLDDLDDLLLKNKQQAEIIERLQADVIRLEEAKRESESRSKGAEQARLDAVKEVVKLASENTELRSKLEPVGTTEPEQNEPEKKPEIKFTLDEAQERFFELRKEFPDKKQKEYLRILDSEGYTNTEGNSVGAYNLNRWCKAHNKSL